MAQDIWSDWLLKRRFGGNSAQLEAVLAHLGPIRDKVLLHAQLREGQTLLDVGSGDGLIAFGALQQTPNSRVVFSDISQELLDHARQIATDSQLLTDANSF